MDSVQNHHASKKQNTQSKRLGVLQAFFQMHYWKTIRAWCFSVSVVISIKYMPGYANFKRLYCGLNVIKKTFEIAKGWIFSVKISPCRNRRWWRVTKNSSYWPIGLFYLQLGEYAEGCASPWLAELNPLKRLH
jgi:hypothetical protein